MESKNYTYRIDHDRNFAPHIENDICILSGCKITTIEKWAKEGSWIIGIGGNNTKQPNKLIYVMKVEEKLEYPEFKRLYPNINYLQKEDAGEYVLLSKRFYYFGDKAIILPKEEFKEIIFNREGSKLIPMKDIFKLEEYIKSCGYAYGKIGNPCNLEVDCGSKKCNPE